MLVLLSESSLATSQAGLGGVVFATVLSIKSISTIVVVLVIRTILNAHSLRQEIPRNACLE